MTRETFNKGMKRFFAVFRDNIDADSGVQEEWFAMLQDIEDVRFSYAVDKICNYNTYFGKTQNFVALIREYSKLYVAPEQEQPQSYEMSPEAHRIRHYKHKEKFKKKYGIDYDSLGDTERDKCVNYVKLLKKEWLKSVENIEGKPIKQPIFDVIDRMK